MVGLVGGTAPRTRSPAFPSKVNNKLVKIFGAGGFSGIPPYGSGILVSPDGYILTVASQMLETQNLRIHLANGDRYQAKIVAIEPELDVAVLKITEENVKTPDYFDITAEAKKPIVEAGTGVLALSNQFNIATRASRCRCSAAWWRPMPSCAAAAASIRPLTRAMSTSWMPLCAIPAAAAAPW